VLLQQLDLADVVGQQITDDLVRLLAHLGQQLVLSPKPRAISSGAARAPSESVATTISTPSSDMCRRSRSATSEMSPTPRPSTNVTPASM
jgi:hypothetical protein